MRYYLDIAVNHSDRKIPQNTFLKNRMKHTHTNMRQAKCSLQIKRQRNQPTNCVRQFNRNNCDYTTIELPFAIVLSASAHKDQSNLIKIKSLCWVARMKWAEKHRTHQHKTMRENLFAAQDDCHFGFVTHSQTHTDTHARTYTDAPVQTRRTNFAEANICLFLLSNFTIDSSVCRDKFVLYSIGATYFIDSKQLWMFRAFVTF